MYQVCIFDLDGTLTDTLDSLETRIHQAEYRIYPAVLRLIAEGRVSIGPDRKVLVSE